VPHIGRVVLRLCVLLHVAVLSGCAEESPRLSLEEGLKCSRDAFKGHPGTFSQRGNTIAYSYESPNGPADVIVMFDARRRPTNTFFESAPLGSHEELMDAAQAIKNCVAYGPKARVERDKNGATSMIGKVSCAQESDGVTPSGCAESDLSP
jgi:hypothetical protein